jgi:hypothetical protein
MNTQTATNINTAKGMPVASVRIGSAVQLWVSSPTGDSSDSHIFTIPCLSEEQAEGVQAGWANIIKTNTNRTAKGMPVGTMRVGSNVQLWVSSPTGDSTDSHIYDIPCIDTAQAEQVQSAWASLIKDITN